VVETVRPPQADLGTVALAGGDGAAPALDSAFTVFGVNQVNELPAIAFNLLRRETRVLVEPLRGV
jgi:hypothetical protein